MDAPIHVRLLNLLGAIRDLAPFSVMTADEEELLRELIVRWHASEKITVSDVMRSFGDKSQTTAYRRVTALRDKGLVALRVDDQDRRVKYVEPTVLAHDYGLRINRAVEQLIGNSDRA